MRGTRLARGDNDRSVHPFVVDLGEARTGSGGPSSKIREDVAVGHKEPLEIRPPCAISHRVVRDGVAALQYFQRMSGGVIGQRELRVRGDSSQGAQHQPD